MEYRQLGASDLKVSALALGTMTFGEQNSEAEAHAQLDLAVAHGVNFIDTAEMYPVAPRAETVGRTESYIGTWLKRQPRDQLIVATKIAGPARGFSWIRNGPRITREQINAALDSSLDPGYHLCFDAWSELRYGENIYQVLVTTDISKADQLTAGVFPQASSSLYIRIGQFFK